MHSILPRRLFWAFVVVVASTLLLSNLTDRLINSSLVKRQPLTDDGSHHVIDKRALAYTAAVVKGRNLYQAVQAAFDGCDNPLGYRPDDLENGWTSNHFNDRGVPPGTQDAFKMIGKDIPDVGEKYPDPSEVLGVNLVQDKSFVNAAGTQSRIPKISDYEEAHYEILYVPLWNAIISADTRSPGFILQKGNPTISKEELSRRVPPLNRQSDVMWEVWKTLSNSPKSFRYLFRNAIVNEDTKSIMNIVWSKLSPDGFGFAEGWPGTRIGMDTEAGLALLGTPNGLAAGYILRDRAKELGKRKLSVTIWTTDPNRNNWGYCMMWDMEPVGGSAPASPSTIRTEPGQTRRLR